VSQFQMDINYKINGQGNNDDTDYALYKFQRISRQIKIEFQTIKPKCSILGILS